MNDQTTQVEAHQHKAGKYLTFALGQETFGLEILKVREIIGMMDITPVPLTPAYIKGIVNLRGRVIPVMDLRCKLGMEQVSRTASTCIVVVYVSGMEIGLIVDKVREVMDIAAESIQDTPSFGSSVDTRFIQGIGKSDTQVTILLDIDKTLAPAEIQALSASAA